MPEGWKGGHAGMRLKNGASEPVRSPKITSGETNGIAETAVQEGTSAVLLAAKKKGNHDKNEATR